MSILKSPGLTRNETAFEIDMRDLLRRKNSRMSNESEEANMAVSSLISQISGQSVQGVRKKLDDDGDRIQRDIGEYAAFSQSMIERTKIVSDGMTILNKGSTKPPEARAVASPSVSPAQ